MKLQTTFIASILASSSSITSFTYAQSIRGSSSTDKAVNTQRDLYPSKDSRIIGGSEASSGRYSYTVSIQDNLGHFCGGSLIAKDVVLTAAHCQGGPYKVVIGRHDLGESSGDVIDMKRELPHPKYNDRTTDNDFNLVFLDRPTTANVEMVTLNSQSSLPGVGDEVTVVGWGDTVAADDVQRLSDKLMEVEVNVISNQECDASEGEIGGWYDTYKNQITKNMLCANDKNQDSCQGDSGGPLVIKGNGASGEGDVQVGVVSWGIGCASQHFPGVYARVDTAYDWIREEVCKGSGYAPASFACSGSVQVDGSSGNNNNNNNNGSGSGSGSGNGKPDKPNKPNKPMAEGFVNNGSNINSSSSSSSIASSSNGNWNTLYTENFLNGFGIFRKGGSDAKHYIFLKKRDGVARIQGGNGMQSSIYSDALDMGKSYSKLRVVFSFFALGMEDNDSFCLDSSTDGGNTWSEEQCWESNDIRNKVWNDDEAVEFGVSNASSVSIRFRCNGSDRKDDVLISYVEIQGLP
ncbi:predicted protein [Thalassiosira pseudonana CCMP1335]|uniref:Peptidase S1 domain-containing protein n=1 Tax=Thalassiosira pseudonana TaxID=35128 RepID=B5YM65_THAPS|nr:predicted protein [Thalassiosira pseudonana CCMP1335]ACI64196.1 predicted protein [Thalassiosira pseudonana CCMP1335]|eukprot:scaffold13354_cov181-Alexandrium_tamarense.AAC.14